MNYLLNPDALPTFASGQAGIRARILNGIDHGVPGVSLILNETDPDDGAPLHRHAYDELFVIEEGCCDFRIGDLSVRATPGQIVLLPAQVPHSFRNPGPDRLRMIAVHAAPRVELERVDSDET